MGRDIELDELRRSLTKHRLVTVTGTGGIGKSSLAVEAVRPLTEEFDVTYVDAESATPGDVGSFAARAMGLTPMSNDDAVDLIVTVTTQQPSLLVLDGCERVLEETAELVEQVLTSSPSLKVLVTSREPLYMPGETQLLLDRLERGKESPSVRLFLDRAGLDPAGLDEAAMAEIARICDRLDGVPLAVELAASRARTLPLSEVDARLDRQLDLLVERRGSQGRHSSLRAALAWSYEMLDDQHQHVFRALSAFRGGFGLDAAVAVLDRPDAADLVAELIDVSLVAPPNDRGRYDLLEPVRQYARELLDESGESEAVLERRGAWMAGFARWARDNRWTTEYRQVLRRVVEEREEIVSVLRWSLDHDVAFAVDIVANLGRIWFGLGISVDLVDLMSRVVDHPHSRPGPALAVAIAHTALALHAEDEDSEQPLLMLERAEAVARESQDDAALGVVLTRKAGTRMGSAGGLEGEQAGYDLLQLSGHPDADSERFNLIGHLRTEGRNDEADRIAYELRDWSVEALGSPSADALFRLAEVHWNHGDLGAAIDVYRLSAEAAEGLGQQHHASARYAVLALVCAIAGRYDEASEALVRSRALEQALGRSTDEPFRQLVLA